jgi:hypothetical protein
MRSVLALGAVSLLALSFLPHEQWSWSPAAKSFVYHGGGNHSGADFNAYAYRPPGV